MIDTSNVKLTIAFTDPNLGNEERDKEVQKLLTQMREVDEIEKISRVRDPNPPEGNMAAAGFLVGLLTAEVNAENIKKVFLFLTERLSGKPLKLKVEANGKKFEGEANSLSQLSAMMEAAEKFVDIK